MNRPFTELTIDETFNVTGGMINHRDAQEKMPDENDILKGASKYYLPEIEMDTGPIYLPF